MTLSQTRAKAEQLLTPELRLIGRCCWFDKNRPEQQQASILELLQSNIDSDRFLDLVRRHRIQALAYTVLSRTEAQSSSRWPWIQDLLPAVKHSRMFSLRLDLDWRVIEKLCGQSGVKVRTLKGPELSKRLYGDIGTRHSRDIDLLTPPEHLNALLSILEQAGYEIDGGSFAGRRQTTAFRIARSIEYHVVCKGVHGTYVEVHTHIERPGKSSFDRIWDEMAWSSDEAIRARFDFLYCTLHGCLHGWSRLKWLGDLRTMAAQLPAAEWPRIIAQAEDLRLDILLAETLLLLELLTGFSPPPATLRLMERCETAASDLAAHALDWITMPDAQLGGMRLRDKVRRWQLGWQVGRRLPLAEHLRYWGAHLLFSPSDLRSFDLPGVLAGLYLLIRPFSLFGRSWFGSGSKAR